MGRDELIKFANELKKEPGVDSVYFYGSRQTGWSKRKNRGPLPDSDWDVGVIYKGAIVPRETLDLIKLRLALENEKIEVTQRSTLAASGDDFLNGLFSQDRVVYEILQGERL